MKKKVLKLFTTAFIAIAVIFGVSEGASAKQTVTIVIDPGHGGPATVATNLGACYGGLQEKDMTLLTAAALKAELERYGNCKVYLTRNADVALGLDQRIAFAKSLGADAVVSVHFNATNEHLLYGSEIFVPCGALYSKGYSMGSCIMKQWTGAGMIDKGIKTRVGTRGDYYGLIRNGANAGIPTIILEHGYMDNAHDSVRLDDAADWQRLAALDAAGIASYYGLKKGATKASVAPTVNVKAPAGIVRDDITPPVLAIQVDSYNPATGEVKYTLTGLEPESRLYAYGVSSLVNPLTDLTLWGKGNTVSGTMMVSPGYVGPISAIVYNNYSLPSNVAVAYVGM